MTNGLNMKNKELPSQRTQKDIQEIQRLMEKEKEKLLQERQKKKLAENEQNQNHLQNLQLNLTNLETKLEYQLRKEKKLLQKEQQNQKKLSDCFVSNNISWKLKSGTFLYPIWEGTYNNVHIFNITKKQLYYELSLVFKGAKSKEFDDVQKQAGILLESLLKNKN